MRVYEISKQLGVSSKDLLELLIQQGFDVHSHMSALSEDAVQFTYNFYNKQESKPVESSANLRQNDIALPEHNTSPKESLATAGFSPQDSTIPSSSSAFSKTAPIGQKQPSDTFVLEPMTLGQAAEKMHKPVNELILTLLKQGIMCHKNEVLPERIIEQLAQSYQIKITRPVSGNNVAKREQVVHGEKAKGRPPIVVVVGHVDHGKTTLLDFIRKTKVAAREKGGITQHVGAYQVDMPQGKIVFLDTPGHAAFSKMRGRGLRIADIAILVVAADDGIMPQTIEAIKFAQEMKVPIMVAINKMDKANAAQVESIKRGLSQYNLVVEEWGGDVVTVPISAKFGEGVDQLLEMIILQTDLMELRADFNAPCQGFVLESKIEKGRGAVATVICHQGTLRVGDFFVAGKTHGKVNSIVDSHGKQLREAGPSLPVQIAGFSQLPDAGDSFEVIPEESYKAAKNVDIHKKTAVQTKSHSSEALNIIVKTDTNSTKEALTEALEKLSAKHEDTLHIVFAGVGAINESDVSLATTTQSLIFGLHVKAEPNTISLAQKHNVVVHFFNIIYKLLEDIEARIKADPVAELIPTKVGEVLVRRIFDIKNIGVIAGSYVKEGRLVREGRLVIWRGKRKVGEGKIKSLERDKKTVKEVHAGFECAFLVDGFNEWEIDDRVECFIDLPKK